MNAQNLADDIITGVPAISRHLGWGRSKTYHAIYEKRIPVGRMGSSYVASKAALAKHFEKITGGNGIL